MHIVALLFFMATLGLAFGLIAVMLLGNADRILMALSGTGVSTCRSVTFVTFGGDEIELSPANDRIILSLAA